MSSESQAAANTFAGFALPQQSKAVPLPNRPRRIEFIGDSHTVGYGNTSIKRECSTDEVWSTTDTAQAFGPMTARRYGAEFQINAISGRGIVRNYNGGAGATLPNAYPFALLDSKNLYREPGWNPQVVVISLGTNDFSTPLNAGERWQSREALHQDYESTFLKFVQDLRRTHRDAFFIVWATGAVNDEIRNEAEKVVASLRQKGEERVAFVPVDGLEMTACHSHPSLADHANIARALEAFIDAHLAVWRGI
jgi:lysophospholipase L1-like esterase